ncbi:MAG: hypothetical protein KAH95_17530 [Spirochaetales bacterium]|nr:hypothetical protein [Spirochaetales bacterium]
MSIVKEYEAKLDNKHRITIRGSEYQYFQVKQYGDGHLELLRAVLVDPKEISKNTLKMMDKSVEKRRNGKVSEPINFDSIKED